MNDLKIITAGSFAGIAQTFVGYPLDTIKVNYIHGKHPNLLSCIKSIKNKGNFYRGVKSPLMGSVLLNIKTFYVYDLLYKHTGNYFMAGSLTGLALSLIETPTDLIKSKMQTNSNKSYTSIIKNNNIYQGFKITALRNFFSVGLFFWGYNSTKTLFKNEYIGSFVGGAAAGFLCWGPTYPLDNIKTRIQTSNKTTGIIECMKKTGFKRMWTGFSPCIIRSVIVNPFVFLAYELGIKYLQ